MLQHPHELRKKNRSLPLVELCLLGKNKHRGEEEKLKQNCKTSDASSTKEEDFVMKTIVGRKFRCENHSDDATITKIFRDPNEVVVLVFPHKHAADLQEGIRLAEERCGFAISNERGRENDSNDSTSSKKINLIFIDATWKHAREMVANMDTMGEWPKNLIQVQMTPTDYSRSDDGISTNNAEDSIKSKDNNSNEEQTFIERRFNIRTPPSPDLLSTAECVAWVVSRVEHNPQIYQSITKVLDCMVEMWRDCYTS